MGPAREERKSLRFLKNQVSHSVLRVPSSKTLITHDMNPFLVFVHFFLSAFSVFVFLTEHFTGSRDRAKKSRKKKDKVES